MNSKTLMEGDNLLGHKKKGFIIFLVMLSTLLVIFLMLYRSILMYFFPIEYTEFIMKYSKKYDLDPYLVSAIINVESHYDPYALSIKDARGLMQITSSTGNWIADKLNIKGFQENMLYNPEINIYLGCWYLNNLGQEFDFDTKLMLAAYNGGRTNVKRWLKDKRYSQTGLTLDQIPFGETEQYVNKVLRNYKIYKMLYSNVFEK